ncbi:MAG: acyltransferase family protein [Cyclobacteriaceae bacterium]
MSILLKNRSKSSWFDHLQVKLFYQKGVHWPVLDSIRGLAIILVLLFHCFPYIGIFGLGWFGVDLFFVLSGFLITGILVDTVDHPHYWRNFAGRRVLRIFPLYYFSLLIFVVINWLFADINNHEAIQFNFFINHQHWYWLYISNWLVMFEGDWLPTSIFNHYWSLAIEEQFYLLWPVLVVMIYKWRPKYFIYVPLIFILFILMLRFILLNKGVAEIPIYNFTFTRLDAISFGALTAVIIRSKRFKLFLQRYIIIFFAGALLLYLMSLMVSGSLSPLSAYFLTYGYTLNAFLFACFILISLANTRYDKIKMLYDNQFFRFFGKYSYAIYIFHWPVYRLFFDDFIQLVNMKFIASLMVVAITVGLSLLSWYVLEKQFLKLKVHFKYN